MTTATKTAVTPSWTASKMQEATARASAGQCAAAMQVLSKYGDEAVKEYQAATRKFRIAHLKEMGANSPLSLAKAMAEFEVNVFGSKIDVAGDDKAATLTYNSCAMWDAMQKVTNMSQEQQEQMGQKFQTCMQDLAHELGMKADVKMDEKTCAITFTK